MLPPFGNPELIIYILHYINITRDEKPFGLYRYLSEEKKVERCTSYHIIPDTVEHHARQVSGERESAGGEP